MNMHGNALSPLSHLSPGIRREFINISAKLFANDFVYLVVCYHLINKDEILAEASPIHSYSGVCENPSFYQGGDPCRSWLSGFVDGTHASSGFQQHTVEQRRPQAFQEIHVGRSKSAHPLGYGVVEGSRQLRQKFLVPASGHRRNTFDWGGAKDAGRIKDHSTGRHLGQQTIARSVKDRREGGPA